MSTLAPISSHRLLDLLMAEPSVGRCLVAPDGTILRVNEEWLRATGFSLDEALGAELVDLFPETRDMALAMHARARAGHRVDVPPHAQRVNGRETWWEGSIDPVPMEGGIGLLVTARELRPEPAPEQKRVEEALRRTLARCERQVRLFESVAATTPDFVYLFDLEGRFLYANRRLLEVWGMELPEVIGKTCRELGYEQWHHDMHMREIAQVIATRLPIKGEVPFKAPRTGVAGIYEYIFTPVIGPDGGVETIAGTTRDVTERKTVEDALREADRRKDEFLAMIAHELRNPLAPIRNSVWILERADASGEQARRAREVIRRQTAHLTRLVDDLLDLSRITHGRIELRRERVDLREVLGRVADDVRPMLESRGLTFRAELPRDGIWSEVDATRITQAVGNLLHNAGKFTRAGDEVTLALVADDDGARVQVRDTGAGIDSALLPTIFDPFVQGERTLARSEGGLGLGLALVKGIVELHGGTVRATSAGRDRGAEFVIRLPLARAEGGSS